MKDSIVARVEFSFRGVNYELESQLDLEHVLDKFLDLPSLHNVMAVEHDIDTYSYIFEVMELEPIIFRDATGRAADFLHDGEFDLEGYKALLGESEKMDTLRVIASIEMGIENLDKHPQLKSALMRAYQLGLEA